MTLSVHFGTHLDAPYHFIEGGKTIDQIEPDLLLGPCLVVALPEVEKVIEPAHLAGNVQAGTKRLLVKTRNSSFVRAPSFREDYVAFSEASAKWLVGQGVRLLGLDYFSVAPYDCQPPTHVSFLSAGGAVVETLDLSGVEPGTYELCCLPLRIQGSGGAPARVLLGKPDRARSP
jgi:arylformamidase